MRLLAGREHSRLELWYKLSRRGHEEGVIEPLLDELAAAGLQSDERFAEAFVQQRMAAGYGPLRIRAELRERGIADVLTDRFLPEDPDLWQDHLVELVQRRFGGGPVSDRRELGRRARFLERRGFPTGWIRRILVSPYRR